MKKHNPKEYARALMEAIRSNPHKEEVIIQNFVRLLAKNGEFSQWRNILPIFENMRMRQKGRKLIEVFFAKESDARRALIETQAIPDADITITKDPSLIGGIRIFINKEILIDGSVRSRVARLFKGLGPR